MEILQSREDKNGSFYIQKETLLAELTYSFPQEKVMRIDHTEVDESLKGLDIGKQLVERAIEFAREKSYKIIPRCSFAKAVMEKRKEEFSDVLMDSN